MIKLTVLYGHPRDEHAFERYYADTHLPIAAKMKDVCRLELTRFRPASDDGKPTYYRMAEIYFRDAAQLEAALASEPGQAAIADLPNFATGGVTTLIGSVEDSRYEG